MSNSEVIEPCKTTAYNDHFPGVRKMINLGKGAERTREPGAANG